MWADLEAYWPAQRLLRDADRLLGKIEQSYRDAHPNGEDPSTGDVASWRESLYELATALADEGLGQVWMFVEYRVDQRMNPIDVVLAGVHPSGGLSYAVFELKQWGDIHRPQLTPTMGLCPVCRTPGTVLLCQSCATGLVYAPFYGKHKKHPAVQVYDNMVDLRKYHSMFDDRYVKLVGAAYLHELKRQDAQWISMVGPHGNIPTFTARQPAALRTFLRTHFSTESGAEASESLLTGRRSGSLLSDDMGAIANGHTRFSLVENQRKAVDAVMDSVTSVSPAAKKVYVVSGRAGSGKSLVALTLLGEARAKGHRASYVSGGAASWDNFRRGARGHGKAFETLNRIADKRVPDELDLLLCDEAHRLPERPLKGSFHMRDGESSVAVVVSRARVPVFFIDGDQRLFANEIWTPDALRREIACLGAEMVPIHLDRVLRAVGSATYDTWAQQLLHGQPVPWDTGDQADPEPFQLYYTDRAARMEEFLRATSEDQASARISAGMCWEWNDLSGTVPEVAPEPEWARPWNAGDNHKTPGVPKRKFWATHPGGFGQIGCVHTAQGLEYEWGGVIMGPDLTRGANGWVVHREHVKSKARDISTDDDLLRAILNAYGVLMSRSIRGTVLYSVDPATRELFADLGVPKL
ncbi:DNA/RNA helicase domain-containing protein [Streptomyces sp. NPDC004111]|uniref:DNA/RNA helicase domain-containing protein n=1 Tax=Streptomyces sp. NPDC004111 TaxID=3364690 RepID=UPI00369260A7